MKCVAAVREVPKSSREWELPGGHLWCSTKVSSTENKWNLGQFYCWFGRPAVIFYLLPPFCKLSAFGRTNPSSRVLLSSTSGKTSEGKLCRDFGVPRKCFSPVLVVTFPKSTVTSQLSVASTHSGAVAAPSALQGNHPRESSRGIIQGNYPGKGLGIHSSSLLGAAPQCSVTRGCC